MKFSFSTLNAIGASLVPFLMACESSARVVGTQNSQNSQSTTRQERAVSRLSPYMDTVGLVVGAARRLVVEAYDDRGDHVSTDRAVVTSSNWAVVQVAEPEVVSITAAQTGQAWKELFQVLRFVGPGTAFVAVTLASRSYTIQVFVLSTPTNKPALVVDSFTVVEYPAPPYLLYAPLLRLREPTGKTTVEIISVEFTLGSRTTGVCRGTIFYPPGTSAHLNGIDDYLWNNDLIFVSPNGSALSGDATAFVVMRDADGNYSELTATTTVQRMVLHPTLPPSQGTGWACH